MFIIYSAIQHYCFIIIIMVSSNNQVIIDMVRWQFEICLLDILCWPDFDLVSLRKTPAKDPFPPSPVAPVSDIQEAPEDDDDDGSEPDDFCCSPSVELFPEDQVQELNFIVEGCVFRGDIEIPTHPPSDSEQDDSRAPWEREDLPELDYDGYQAQWERDEVNGSNRMLADEPRYREPSPQSVRFIPSAAFTRSRVGRSAATLHLTSSIATSLNLSDQ
jgi:hypothetical protein